MIRNILRNIAVFSFLLLMSFVVGGGAMASAQNSDCIRALANDLAGTIMETVDEGNDVVIISSDMLIEFFTKNIDICRDYLLARESPDEDISVTDPDLMMDIRWDYIVEEVAAALSTTSNSRVLFVCENNRSYQAGIDAALWAVTIVAAVFSYGSGGVAIQGARTAVTQGAKNLTKVGVKKGMKAAAVEATAKRMGLDIAGKAAAEKAAQLAVQQAGKTTATAAARDAAVAAAKTATRKAANDAIIIQTKAALKSSGKKRVTDAMIKKEIQAQIAAGATNTKALTQALNLLDDKAAKAAAKRAAQKAVVAEITSANAELASATAALTAERAAASSALKSALTKFAISTPIAVAGGIASVYSFLQSNFDMKVMNCVDTDAGEGCYTSCTKDPLGTPTDDLNQKVFKPIFGKYLCVDENTNYALREISSGLPMPGDIFTASQDKWEKAKSEINTNVKDKGHCDWNEDDIDIYVAVPMYDPSTLMPTGNGATGLIIDGMRIDE